MLKISLIIFILSNYVSYLIAQCNSYSPTTVSGTHAPKGQICSGQLIFEDNFDEFDLKKWSHEITLGGGGNWEFQWYTNSRYNSYVENSTLFIKPTLVADEYGEKFLWSGTADVRGGSPADECTNPLWWGCQRDGTKRNYLNPVKSARVRTVYSFNFKYGKVEIKAKVPSGDWLWPAIWMLPRYNQYSGWPTSGEIDIMETRCNRELINSSGVNIGVQLSSSTLHWGPAWNLDGKNVTHVEKYNPDGFDSDWHKYQMIWDENSISFLIDNELLQKFEPPESGFWEWGNFNTTRYKNPWKTGKSKLAPFDQEFYLIFNLAIGGISYFPDDAINPGGKPWSNTKGHAATDFWKGRNQWLPTWDLESDKTAFKVDYVRVWAL